ncbi:hypothetical protein T265_06582 [Opisthorchis viverrini]|uniref:Uncharacterized protein n=1 Tax=Opisthorchis viverrini TaxID=6198 RepID=A0A074ZK00_OPIVI|nr:hypothetical protein T265_06582 [Opisthorchis viverrini]KER26102.1 hypothetical protein T265_06582 [Opisthorchis viverrini]
MEEGFIEHMDHTKRRVSTSDQAFLNVSTGQEIFPTSLKNNGFMVVGMFAELGNLLWPHHQPTATHNYALMMSSRLVMKRLQPNCPAQRTCQRPTTLPELPTFSSIEKQRFYLT